MEEHPEIPEGIYCYKGLGVVEGVLKIKTCPHWKKTEKGARCNLLNREDTEYCEFHLLWDQVKECSFNKDESNIPSKFEGIEKEVMCRCGKTLKVIESRRVK